MSKPIQLLTAAMLSAAFIPAHADIDPETMEAARKGDRDAQYIVGAIYEYGNPGYGIKVNYTEALKWYMKAAHQGDPDAQQALGNMFIEGKGVNKDYVEAMDWCSKSADQNNHDGMKCVGNIHLNGLGVPKNKAEAQKWLDKAADIEEAKYLVAQHGDSNQAPPKAAISSPVSVKEKAAPAVIKSTAKDAQAAYAQKDFAKALQLARPLAEAEDAEAQGLLGVMYFLGQGVDQDYEESLKWSRKAADQGNVAGMNGVGLMYLYGLGGVERNLDQAGKWLRKSAAAGDQFAKDTLAGSDFAEKAKSEKVATPEKKKATVPKSSKPREFNASAKTNAKVAKPQPEEARQTTTPQAKSENEIYVYCTAMGPDERKYRTPVYVVEKDGLLYGYNGIYNSTATLVSSYQTTDLVGQFKSHMVKRGFRDDYADCVAGGSALELKNHRDRGRNSIYDEALLKDWRPTGYWFNRTESWTTQKTEDELNAKPLRFLLVASLNKAINGMNASCISNVVTVPGPRGWGIDTRQDLAMEIVQSYIPDFESKCAKVGPVRRQSTSIFLNGKGNESRPDDNFLKYKGYGFPEVYISGAE